MKKRLLLLCLTLLMAATLPLAARAPKPQKKIETITVLTVPAEQKDSGHLIGNVELSYADGSKKVLTDSGKCMIPQFSPGGIVAWTSFEQRNDYDEPINDHIRVFFPDGRTLDLERGPFVEELSFQGGETQLAVKTRGRHGPAHYALFDLVSGKLLESIDEYVEYDKAPKWAQAVHDDRPEEP